MTEPKMGIYPIRRKLPVSYSTEIGRIITQFALFESALRTITYHLLKIGPKQGRIAVRQPRVSDHLAMIQDLEKLARVDLGVDWSRLKIAAKAAESFRDRLAHGVWLKHDTTKTPVLQDFSAAYIGGSAPEKPKLYPIANPVALETLRGITASIHALNNVAFKIQARAEALMRKP